MLGTVGGGIMFASPKYNPARTFRKPCDRFGFCFFGSSPFRVSASSQQHRSARKARIHTPALTTHTTAAWQPWNKRKVYPQATHPSGMSAWLRLSSVIFTFSPHCPSALCLFILVLQSSEFCCVGLVDGFYYSRHAMVSFARTV